MRVLIAVHGYPPTHYAGAERAAERITNWLVANKHEVEVFTIEKLDEPGFRMESSVEGNITIHRLYYDPRHDDTFRNYYDYPSVGEALQSVLKAKHFDVVHLISGYLLGGQVIHTVKLLQIPVVVTLTEYWYLCTRLNLLQPDGSLCAGPDTDIKCARCLMEEKRRYRLPTQIMPKVMDVFWSVNHGLEPIKEKITSVGERRALLREALNAADLVISPSKFLITKYAAYGFDTSHYIHIRHGLNLPIIEKNTDPTTFDRPLRIGYVGQIKYHKGIDILIDAVIPLFDKGRKIVLEIWGPDTESPSYGEQLRKQTENYKDIHWNGRYDGPAVWGILSNLDVLVVPSRWYENSPTVILEAFNVGLPVITTNLGGMAELVEHEQNGLLFELNNSQDLRQQIERIIDHPELLAQLRTSIPKVPTADEEIQTIFTQYERLVNPSLTPT